MKHHFNPIEMDSFSEKFQNELGYDNFFIDTGIIKISRENNKKNYFAGLYDMNPIFRTNLDAEYYIIGYSRRKDTKGIWKKAQDILNDNEVIING